MNASTIIKVGIIAAAGLLLAACSHSSTSTSGAANSGASASDSTQSYGMGDTAGYQSAQAANGMHINSLKAPSNQTYYFDFDSNQLHASDLKALIIQANYLATHKNARVRLEGNTDNLGSREYNIGLGWRRDQAVARYLTQRGVSPKQIQMVSYGKEHPAVIGDTTQDRALNRRVNLIYKVS